MATSPQNRSDGPDQQATLSHVVKRLLQREGGSVAVERVTLRVSDFVDLGGQEAANLIDQGADRGIYQLRRANDGNQVIHGVSPEGREPDVVAQAFGDQPADDVDFTRLPDVDDTLDAALKDAGYRTFRALAEATPATVADEVEGVLDDHVEPADFEQFDPLTAEHAAALEAIGIDTHRDLATADVEALETDADAAIDEIVDPADLSRFSVVTESQAEALRDAGYETLCDLAAADVDALAGVTTTFTDPKAEKLIETASETAPTFDEDLASRVIEQGAAHATQLSAEQAADLVDVAEQFIPIGLRLATQAATRYVARTDETGHGTAVIRQIDETTEPVGDPSHVTDPELDPTDADAQYVSDIGVNADEPVETGFHILNDPAHPQVPKPETHSDAGDDALPVDDDGVVIPPAVPIEPRLQLQLDELVAKKLARGLVPIRIVGPRGSGKNYLLKYLCHATNRGYVSVDVDQATMPEDLFGPLTPDEHGAIEPKNGAVKQGLLTGCVVVINEFPVMQAGAAMALHRLLNEGKLLIKSHGELVEPHPAARLVITMNPPTREYRDSEPMNSATRGRFRGFEQPYPQSVEAEVASIAKQVNTSRTVIDEGTLTKIVQFAHKTREAGTQSWPTLSTRNLTIVCEHIADGASPKAAVKNELWAVAEPNQYPEDAHDKLNDYL